jgi:hypothetical protein
MKILKKWMWAGLLALPTLLTITSCKKFLDKKPLQSTLDDLNQGKLESQALNMYFILRTYAGFEHLPWIDFHSIRDDDAQKGSDANDGKEIVTLFDTYVYGKDGWAPETYWNDHFYMINQANNGIATAIATGVSDPASQRNIGELCFFRAFAYFDLVRSHGEVPLINFEIVKPTDGIQPKASIDRIYDFIDSNLQIASEYLPLNASEYGKGYAGRITKGAAQTLWAQAYLFRKQWAKVVELCTTVKASGQYSLPKFTEIWKDGLNGAGKNGPESIWETNNNAGANAATNSSVDNGAWYATAQQVRQNGAPPAWNLGWGWNTPTDKLVGDWDDTDPRKRQTILFSGQYDGGEEQGGFGATLPAYTNPDGSGGLAQKYWNKKVYSDPAMRIFTGFVNAGNANWINHRRLRFADVLLMLAEASNELADGPTAAANLELVRNRASGFLGQNRTILPYIAFTNQAQMRDAIKKERRFEFAMEGYRFYDLVRWGDAQAVLGGLGYTNKCRYYPIPQKAIDLAGGVLVQNPEW